MIRVTMHAVDETGEKHDVVQATLLTAQYLYWHHDLINLAEKCEVVTDEIH